MLDPIYPMTLKVTLKLHFCHENAKILSSCMQHYYGLLLNM